MDQVDTDLLNALDEEENTSLNVEAAKKPDEKVKPKKDKDPEPKVEPKAGEEKPKKDVIDDLIVLLNEQQQEAVMSSKKHIAVEAGPGSGKTAILVARAGVLAKNWDPEQTMLITFTRKAAKQMRERLSMFTDTDKMWIGTFHSIAFKILRNHYGADKKYRIWDTDDRIAVLKKIYGKDDMNTVRDISEALTKYFADETVTEEEARLIKEALPRYRQAMEEKEKAESVIIFDLDEIIRKAIQVIKEDEITVKNLLVDEAQDMNPIQKQFVDALQAEYLFIVGDPKQSIYEFRGATSAFFKKIMENLPLYTLKINYRNATEILDAAEAIYERGLIPMRKEGNLYIKFVQNQEAELELVKSVINPIVGTQETLAVLSRTRLEAHEVSAFLTRNKIQHTVIGEYNLFKRKEIKDAIAYLDVVNNPRAIESFLRIVNEPKRGIGKSKKEELQKVFESSNDDVVKVLLVQSEKWGEKPRKNAEALAQVIINARKIQGTVKDVLQYVLDQSGYYEAIEENRRMHLQVLYELATQFRDTDEFIAYTHMGAEQTTKDAQIIVSTIHAVKGLEFDTVIILNAVNGYVPMAKDDNEQEKNLFYVAVTRAKKALYIVVPSEIKMPNGEVEESVLSPYVKLILNKRKEKQNVV